MTAAAQNARTAVAITAPISSFLQSTLGAIAGLVLHLGSLMQSRPTQTSQTQPTSSRNDAGTALNDAATARVIAAYLEYANDDPAPAGATESAASESTDPGTAHSSAPGDVQVTAQDQIANLQHDVAGAGSLMHSAMIISTNG